MALSKNLEKLSPEQHLAIAANDLSYFALKYITLENLIPFSFNNHRYLLDVYQDDHPNQVHEKCTQMGITTWAMLKSIHACMTMYPLGVAYFFPTDSDVTEFSKTRMKPIIDQNEIISQEIGETDDVHVKSLGGAFLYLRGMKSKLRLKSIPADMIVIDELDETSPESVDMAEKRLSASIYKHKVKLSNPTIPDYGIDAEFIKSDQRYWFLKCGCGLWNDPLHNFPNNIKANLKDIDDPGKVVCSKCGKALDPQRGKWVAKYPSRKEIRGYHYNQLMSVFVRPSDILREYHKARITGRLGVFYNLSLGLPYVTATDKIQKEEVLGMCDPDFPSSINDQFYMGIDQGNYLHVVFMVKRGDKFLTWYLMFTEFEDLHKWLRHKKMRRCVIDALPETHEARKLVKRFPGKVYMNYYVQDRAAQTRWNDENNTVQEGRTESLDASHSLLEDLKLILPANDEDADEFATHCSALVRKKEVKKDTGETRYVWVKTKADHYRHALNYAYIAYLRDESVGGISVG